MRELYLRGFEIARAKGIVDWCFLRAGLEKGLIGRQQIVEFATESLDGSNAYSPDVVELAGADVESDVRMHELLTALCPSIPNGSSYLERWRLCILLAVRELHASRPIVALERLADVYAIFDYPADMARAVPYMAGEVSPQAQIGDVLESPFTALDRTIATLDQRVGSVR